MRNYVFLLHLFTICNSFITAQNTLECNLFEDKEKIKIISYNILNGFDSKKDTERRARFVSWVKAQDPEVMAMQELVGINENELLVLAKEYGHPYAVILKENGYPVGLTSKKPIETIKKRTENFWHGMLHCKTYGMDFIVIHLSPADWQYRHREALQITSYIKENKLDTCMVMGDFNAHSPFDAEVVEQHTDLIKKMIISDSKSANYKNLHDNNFDYSTLSVFLSYPLMDVCRKYVPVNRRGTFPTRILAHFPKDDYRFSELQERIDFILVTTQLFLSCVDAQIYNGTDTDYLSDHYPIAIDMIIPKQK